MKILHVCLAAFYIDNYSYQENMLPKYHKKAGHEVYILASLQTFDSQGKASFLEKEKEYINEYNIPVTRIGYRKGFKGVGKKLKKYNDIYPYIEKVKPDIIFIHGCQFSNMKDIKKYAQNYGGTKIFVDNHCDFSNSATNWISKNILHKIIWRKSARLIEPYTEKFYGVLPARVKFIKEIYKINPQKVELLVMGGDDEKIIEAKREEVKKSIRIKYNVNESDFLIVTGGKIDEFKKQTILLMEAIKEINNPNLKILIFGSVVPSLQKEFSKLVDGEKIQYIGWINSDEVYKYFATSDLVVFPGRHSVFWEQCVGLGTPIVAKYWNGTDHIKFGRNCKFIYEDDKEKIKEIIKEITDDVCTYSEMRKSAKKCMKEFSYKEIACKSIKFD